MNDTIRETGQPTAAHHRITLPVIAQYLVLGAVIGALWLRGSGEPAWAHALRTALVVAIVLPVSYYSAQKLRARRGLPPRPQLSLGRIIAVKLSLLVVALIVSYLIRPVTAHTDEIIAAGLFLTVAVGGPPCHHLFVTPPAGAGVRTAPPVSRAGEG